MDNVVQEAFDRFITTCLINGKELITSGEEFIFSKKLLENCFKDLKQKEEIDYQGDYKKLLLHCYWLMYFFGEKTSKKDQFDNEYKNDPSLFFENRICNIGQSYTGETNKNVILFLLTLLYHIREIVENGNVFSGKAINEMDIKNEILNLIMVKGREKSVESITPGEPPLICNSIANILLYLCSPTDYVAICAQNNKDNIWKYLSFLLSEQENNTVTAIPKEGEETNGTSKNVCNETDDEGVLGSLPESLEQQSEESKSIDLAYDESRFIPLLNAVKSFFPSNNEEYSFYHPSIRPFWDIPKISTKANNEDKLQLSTLLTFKKAIVLYGPPGTSKTYTARELAKNVISATFAEKLKKAHNKKDFKTFIVNEGLIFGKKTGEVEEVMSHVHRLQLHPNYTYEDFIAGKTITVDANTNQTKVDTQKGYLLKLIDSIKDNREKHKDKLIPTLPHIVILDEINRVDISRVFGELFTAMESDYREEGVDLPLTGNDKNHLKLIVPDDLYFIGTMNMIDFSLEQVDFALRRRFAWVESNYEEGRLKDMIDSKMSKMKKTPLGKDIDSYVSRCSALNDLIANKPDLGPTYKIGHAFFSEIIDIYNELHSDNRWYSAIDFLWNISIRPMIDAYCGAMESKVKEEFIKECENKFIPKNKEPKAK